MHEWNKFVFTILSVARSEWFIQGGVQHCYFKIQGQNHFLQATFHKCSKHESTVGAQHFIPYKRGSKVPQKASVTSNHCRFLQAVWAFLCIVSSDYPPAAHCCCLWCQNDSIIIVPLHMGVTWPCSHPAWCDRIFKRRLVRQWWLL